MSISLFEKNRPYLDSVYQKGKIVLFPVIGSRVVNDDQFETIIQLDKDGLLAGSGLGLITIVLCKLVRSEEGDRQKFVIEALAYLGQKFWPNKEEDNA